MRRFPATFRLVAGLCTATGLAWSSLVWAGPPPKPTAQQLAQLCDDCARVTEVHTEQRKGEGSGVGAVGGAVAGGVLGKKLGDSKLATVGGAVLGGLAGNEIEKRVKKHTVWVVSSTRRDGSTQRHEFDHDPALKAGDTVQAEGNSIRKR